MNEDGRKWPTKNVTEDFLKNSIRMKILGGSL